MQGVVIDGEFPIPRAREFEEHPVVNFVARRQLHGIAFRMLIQPVLIENVPFGRRVPNLTLTYQRPDAAPSDLIYTVEVSTNGTSWSSGSGATVAGNTVVSNGLATVTVRDATAVGAPNFGRRIRLSLERRSQP